MIILFWHILIANWKCTTKLLCQHFCWKLYLMLAKLIHSTVAFSLDWPVAEDNLQLNDLCNKTDISYPKTSRVF